MMRAEMLINYLSDVRAKRFRTGTHDCGMFVSAWVEKATGEDHGARWRGRYRSMKKLREIMAEDGFDSHVDYIASLFSEIPPSMAQVGDLAVVDRDAMGIFASDRVFVLHPDGLGHVSRLLAKRAFTV